MRLKAMAKINLGLDILGKRPDGYHEIRTVMQTIQMYDVLELHQKKAPGIRLTTNLPYIPTDARNLVYQAADLLMKEFHVTDGLEVRLEKSIPVAAGMAGGSSDAAAALVGVNRLFRLGLSKQQLMERAVQIGADVPFCVMRGTALAEGIGEKLTRLPAAPPMYILIGKPGVSVSTKQAYGSLKLEELVHPDMDGVLEAIRQRDLYQMAPKLGNVFEPGICAIYPVIREIEDLMEKGGALKAMMSGSGPTVFGIFDDPGMLRQTADTLRKSHLAKTVFATEVYADRGETNDQQFHDTDE